MVVYIIYSETKMRYYVGICKDIEKRLKEHNEGRSRYTKSGIPWEVVWEEKMPSREASAVLEKKIKKRGAGRFLSDKSNNPKKK